MEAFVQTCAAGGLKGHPKVPVDETVVREMVKIYCIVGQEEKALELLQTAEGTYHLTLSAAAYEPLIFHYALLEKSDGGGRPLALAEDALTTLIVNRGLAPSDAIADALLLGHLRRSSQTPLLLPLPHWQHTLTGLSILSAMLPYLLTTDTPPH